jgi:hypothetical protein
MSQTEKIQLQLGLIRELTSVANITISLIEDVTSEGLVQDISKPVSLKGSPFEQEEFDEIKTIIFATAKDIAAHLNNSSIAVIKPSSTRKAK